MRLQPDEARSAPLQVSALQDVVCARLPESRTPEVLFGSGVSKGQQARQATALVGQTRKPRSFPRSGERAAGAGVASSPSGLGPVSGAGHRRRFAGAQLLLQCSLDALGY